MVVSPFSHQSKVFKRRIAEITTICFLEVCKKVWNVLTLRKAQLLGVKRSLTDILATQQHLIIFLKSDLRFKLWVIVISFTPHKCVSLFPLCNAGSMKSSFTNHVFPRDCLPLPNHVSCIETTFQELADMKPTK